MREKLESFPDPIQMPRALWLYVPIYDHFLGAAEEEGGEHRVSECFYHSINKGRTHSRAAHSSSSQQPALWIRQYTLLWAHICSSCCRCVCVCVCTADSVRSLCSWGKWWRHPTDPLQTAGKTLMSLWTCWEVCVCVCLTERERGSVWTMPWCGCICIYLDVYTVLCFQMCNSYPQTEWK